MMYAWRRAVVDDGEKSGSMVFPTVLVQGTDSDAEDADADLLMCLGLDSLWALDPGTGACRWTASISSYHVATIDSTFAVHDAAACVVITVEKSSATAAEEQLLDARSGRVMCVRPCTACPAHTPAPAATSFERQPLGDDARGEVLAELSRRGTAPWSGWNNSSFGCGLLVVRTAANTAVVFSATLSGNIIVSVACMRELVGEPYWTPEPVDGHRVLVVPRHRRHCEVTDIGTGTSRVVALASDLTASEDSPQHLFPFHVLCPAGDHRRPPRAWLASYDSIVACVLL
jgi:hypothetical protein